MEQDTAEAQGKFHSGGGREEMRLEGNSMKKYTLYHFLFLFFLNLNLPGIVLSAIPNECCYK